MYEVFVNFFFFGDELAVEAVKLLLQIASTRRVTALLVVRSIAGWLEFQMYPLKSSNERSCRICFHRTRNLLQLLVFGSGNEVAEKPRSRLFG